MAIAHSKLTAQGQISVPAKVRRKLGVGPGSVLEWDEDGEKSSCAGPDGIRLRTSTGRYLRGPSENAAALKE